ncbi:hypothetical protein CEXT_539071 [Caerostris extrusa]|uniref:Uncharacterized protein n=1 Tax=Caerostris extrusa TaxID=172846 RepID=A0AAV4RF21_CAEEX|nr:hypothetical protein CEXT_539071 [Caerostris extrusa]
MTRKFNRSIHSAQTIAVLYNTSSSLPLDNAQNLNDFSHLLFYPIDRRKLTPKCKKRRRTDSIQTVFAHTPPNYLYLTLYPRLSGQA